MVIHQLNDLLKYDITQALLSEKYAEKLVGLSSLLNCRFAIDIGMRRIVLNADKLDYCERVIRDYSNKIKLEGIFTQLCVAGKVIWHYFYIKNVHKL